MRRDKGDWKKYRKFLTHVYKERERQNLWEKKKSYRKKEKRFDDRIECTAVSAKIPTKRLIRNIISTSYTTSA